MIRDIVEVRSTPIDLGERDEPLRIAVFGAGKAARFHLEALDQIDGVEIAAVCSRSGTSAEALVADRPGAVASSDQDAVLAAGGIDAAIVAVIHGETAATTRRILTAGLPVLVEKPAALTSAEAHALADQAESTGTLALVGVNRRYYSLLQGALAAVRQRGPVRAVVVEGHEQPLNLRRQGVSTEMLADWHLINSVHTVDLLRMLGGEPTEVHVTTGSASSSGSFDVSATLRFADGAVGTYLASWDAAWPQVVRIYGEQVTAEVQMSQPEQAVVAFAGGRRIALQADWADSVAKAGVLAQDGAFLRSVVDGRPAGFPASDLRDHAATLALVEQLAGLG